MWIFVSIDLFYLGESFVLYFTGVLKSNFLHALQSTIRRMAGSTNVFYDIMEADILLSSERVIGAELTDTVDKVMKLVRKRRSEDQPRRGKSIAVSDIKVTSALFSHLSYIHAHGTALLYRKDKLCEVLSYAPKSRYKL